MRTLRGHGFLTRWLINAVILLLLPFVMGPAVEVTGVIPALVAAFVLGIVNALIRPVLIILSLPIQVLTLGLFTFIINGLMLWLVARLVGGFYIAGFWPAVLASILLSVGSSILSFLVRDRSGE
ncbi:MAG: phage holin family protein [Bacillota bacterium]|nr:phage holin family protein [Bacillota bacterium]